MFDGMEEMRKEFQAVSLIKYYEESHRAFNAMMAYEKNCISKYDHPLYPSKVPIKGERMEDFALKYGTTVKEMKACAIEVERELNK